MARILSIGGPQDAGLWPRPAPVGVGLADRLDLLQALPWRGEEQPERIALEIGRQRPPQSVRLRALEPTD